MEYPEFDMLGDPVPPNWEGRGRPPHVATKETWLKVNLLWATGASNEDCAQALGITQPTFNKHYFNNSPRKKARAMARWKLKAENLAQLQNAAAEGNVAAIKEMRLTIERLELKERAERMAGMAPKTEPPRGKKEQMVAAAKQVGGKFAPPAPPLQH